MDNDLAIYNYDTLQELYAVSFWKAYKVWPRANSLIKRSKKELIQDIQDLSTKLESES